MSYMDEFWRNDMERLLAKNSESEGKREHLQRQIIEKMATESTERIISPLGEVGDFDSVSSIELCFGLSLCCTPDMVAWLEEAFVRLKGLDSLRALGEQKGEEKDDFTGIIEMLTPEHARNFMLLVGCFACVKEGDTLENRNSFMLEQFLRIENEEMYRAMKRKYHDSRAPYSAVYGPFLLREEEITIEEFTSNGKILLRFLTSFILSNTYRVIIEVPTNEIEASFGRASMGVLKYLKTLRRGFSVHLPSRKALLRRIYGTSPDSYDWDSVSTFFHSAIVTEFFKKLGFGEGYIDGNALDFGFEVFEGYRFSDSLPVRRIVERLESYYVDCFDDGMGDDYVPNLPFKDLLSDRLSSFGYLYKFFNSNAGEISTKEAIELLADIIVQFVPDGFFLDGLLPEELEVDYDAVTFFDALECGLLEFGIYQQYLNSNAVAVSTYEYDELSKKLKAQQDADALSEELSSLRAENEKLRAGAEAEKKALLEASQKQLSAETKKLRDASKQMTNEIESQKRKLEKANAEISRLQERLQAEKDQSLELFALLHEEADEEKSVSDIPLSEKLAYISRFRLCLCGGHFDNIAKLKKDAVVVAEYGDSGISNNADVDIVIYFTEWMSHRVFYSAQSWCRKTKTPHIYVSGAKNYDLIVDKIYTKLKEMEEKGDVQSVK